MAPPPATRVPSALLLFQAEVEGWTSRVGPERRSPEDWAWTVAVGLNEPRADRPWSEHFKAHGPVSVGASRGHHPAAQGTVPQSLNVDNFDYTAPVGGIHGECVWAL